MDFTKVPFLLKRKGLDAITVVPSLGTLALLNERSTARPGRSALLIGDPVLGDPSLPRLPHALREIETIGKLHHNPVTLAGAAATRARLDATKPGRFGTLHFATHTHRGRMPAILLGPESAGAGPVALTPNDVMGLDLADTNLVVLSACASGRGRVMGTEGLIGLPRAFLIAGARRVVASTVSVVDEKTSALMGSFYGQLKNGQAPAAALLAAQRDLLGRGTTSWPGYWGSFFVVGAP
jgi:CHAT domain-containing protein